MKKYKIIFWITTGIIAIFEGVLTGLTSHTEMSIEGITHLGYPIYFIAILAIFKVLGSFALIMPRVPRRIKEWAYAGFGIDFISATASMWIVDGFSLVVLFPVVFLIILALSYISYNKLHANIQ